jgi:signal transduction histidine kinase
VRRGAEKGVWITFGTGLGVLLVVLFFTGTIHSRFLQNTSRVAQTHQVLRAIDVLFSLIKDAESARRGFILAGEEQFLTRFGQSQEEFRRSYDELKRLVSDDPVQSRRVQDLQPLITAKFQQMEESIALWRAQGRASMPRQEAITRDGEALFVQIRARIAELQFEEERLLTLRNSRLDKAQQATQAVVYLFSVAGIGVLVLSIFSVTRDLNHRRHAEKLLERSNEELKSFGYTVSHDLKAPLRGISGYAQELQRKHGSGLSERGVFCLNQILHATQNLDRLIDDLLTYSRLTEADLEKSPVAVKPLLENILQPFRASLSERGVSLDVLVQIEEVIAWERGLQQALSNVIDNAVKYTRKTAAAKIIIKAYEDRDRWVFEVQDNGPGFPMEYRERIFGLFNRLVRGPEFEGTGAGLAIARKLVEKQGGVIHAKSEPGQATSFFLELPKPGKALGN